MCKDIWCQIAELSINTWKILFLIIILIKIILMPTILFELKSQNTTNFLIRRNLFNVHISPCIRRNLCNFHISPCFTFPPAHWLFWPSSIQAGFYLISFSQTFQESLEMFFSWMCLRMILSHHLGLNLEVTSQKSPTVHLTKVVWSHRHHSITVSDNLLTLHDFVFISMYCLLH